MKLITVPGFTGSDPGHWQSRWELLLGPAAARFQPASWDAPELDDWRAAVRRAVTAAGEAVVLVTHSLGCLAAAEAAAEPVPQLAGVVLVAPPDPVGPNFPATAASSFCLLQPRPVAVPGLVITSRDDPYCSPARAAWMADGWALPTLEAGAHGHLNTASGLGDWPWGRAVLTAFLAGLGAEVPGLG